MLCTPRPPPQLLPPPHLLHFPLTHMGTAWPPRPRCPPHAKHASALRFGTYSLLRLLFIPSLLSRPRLKAISVEAFSDHSALYECTPPSLPFTPLSVSSQHLQSCDHDPFTHLFPVCPPATRISTAWGQGFFCFVHSYIPSTKNRSGAPWIFVEPWFTNSFITRLICDMIL